MKEDNNPKTDEKIDTSDNKEAAAGAAQENENKAQADEQQQAHEKNAELANEIESLKNQLLRRAAEFENYKRRTENETISIIRMANEGLIIELLSVLDDLERSLKSGREHPDLESFYKGIELVNNKLLKILESLGMKRFVSLGRHFDVEFHDALLQMPRADVEPSTIIDEIESGYTLQEKVIRHAKVIVAAEAAEDSNAGDAPSDGNEISADPDLSAGDKKE